MFLFFFVVVVLAVVIVDCSLKFVCCSLLLRGVCGWVSAVKCWLLRVGCLLMVDFSMSVNGYWYLLFLNGVVDAFVVCCQLIVCSCVVCFCLSFGASCLLIAFLDVVNVWCRSFLLVGGCELFVVC